MLRGSGCYDLCALPHDPPECGGEHAVDFLWGKLETRPANYLFLLMQCNKKDVVRFSPKLAYNGLISMLKTCRDRFNHLQFPGSTNSLDRISDFP